MQKTLVRHHCGTTFLTLISYIALTSAFVLQIALHRSDALVTVIDLDKDMKIVRADEAAALMFGVTVKQLMHKSLPRWAL